MGKIRQGSRAEEKQPDAAMEPGFGHSLSGRRRHCRYDPAIGSCRNTSQEIAMSPFRDEVILYSVVVVTALVIIVAFLSMAGKL
jgi:hypothetical protein